MSEREERCDRGGGGSGGGELKQHLMEIPTAAAGEEEKEREGSGDVRSYAGVMHGNIGTEREGEEMGWRGEMEGRETAASTVSTLTTTPSLPPPLRLRARLRWRWRESDAAATQSVWHPAYINMRHCAPRWYSSGRAHPTGNFAAKTHPQYP